MKKNDVKIGGVYAAKVTDKVVPVRIDAENTHGGWDATNQATGKKVRIKSAQRLRGPWPKKFREQMQAAHKADQENARLADERGKSPDGQTASELAMATSAPAVKKATKASKEAKKAPGRDTGQRRGTSAKTATKGTADAKAKRLSILDAAVKVLEERDPTDGPLSCKQMVKRMAAKGYWEPRQGGLTPANTLYSALLREIKTKGEDSRFDKVERGKFSLSLKS